MTMSSKLTPSMSKKCLSIIFKSHPDELELGLVYLLIFMVSMWYICVRTNSNAYSTLDALNADVSM
jgi:hypothetical protein